MKKEDLRIGNLVEQGVVESIGNGLIQVNDTIYEIEMIKPIKLDSDVLNSFRFYSCETNYYYTKWIYTNNKSRVKNWTLKLFNGKGSEDRYKEKLNLFFWDKIEVNYAHQLQNLYFALNGEEL